MNENEITKFVNQVRNFSQLVVMSQTNLSDRLIHLNVLSFVILNLRLNLRVSRQKTQKLTRVKNVLAV